MKITAKHLLAAFGVVALGAMVVYTYQAWQKSHALENTLDVEALAQQRKVISSELGSQVKEAKSDLATIGIVQATVDAIGAVVKVFTGTPGAPPA